MLPRPSFLAVFFFNDTATTEIYTLSLHDALPISASAWASRGNGYGRSSWSRSAVSRGSARCRWLPRSEEHTSELQSLAYLVCRLLLEKKKKKINKSLISKKKKIRNKK